MYNRAALLVLALLPSVTHGQIVTSSPTSTTVWGAADVGVGRMDFNSATTSGAAVISGALGIRRNDHLIYGLVSRWERFDPFADNTSGINEFTSVGALVGVIQPGATSIDNGMVSGGIGISSAGNSGHKSSSLSVLVRASDGIRLSQGVILEGAALMAIGSTSAYALTFGLRIGK